MSELRQGVFPLEDGTFEARVVIDSREYECGRHRTAERAQAAVDRWTLDCAHIHMPPKNRNGDIIGGPWTCKFCGHKESAMDASHPWNR